MKKQFDTKDSNLNRLSSLTKLNRDQMKNLLGGVADEGTYTTSSCNLGCAKDGYCSTCCLA